MMKALAVFPLVLATACLGESTYGRLPDPPTTPIEFTQLHAGDRPIVVATGGVQKITIPDPNSIGWSGTASAGFEVEPYGDIWPNERKPEYHVRALAASQGEFSIVTERGLANGTVISAAVARIAAVPADYQLDGHSAFTVDASRPLVEIALYDVDGNRLVDGSLAFDTASSGWDRVTLPSSPGAYTIRATADSFAEQPLAIELVDRDAAGTARIESVRDGTRTCFHAYAGEIEIATAMPISGTRDPNAINCELAPN